MYHMCKKLSGTCHYGKHKGKTYGGPGKMYSLRGLWKGLCLWGSSHRFRQIDGESAKNPMGEAYSESGNLCRMFRLYCKLPEAMSGIDTARIPWRYTDHRNACPANGMHRLWHMRQGMSHRCYYDGETRPRGRFSVHQYKEGGGRENVFRKNMV